MKMKTQIKRKAKKTLSLLLTAMLVISTMIVGISTVSAVGTLQPTTTPVADGYYRVFVTDNYKFGNAPQIHYWGGSSSTAWGSRPTMNKVTGTNDVGQNVYWYDVPSNSTGVIFQHSGKDQSVDLLVQSDKTLKFQNGAGYYISGQSSSKYVYSYWDASSLLPSNSVASSVTLTASSSSVRPNEEVTLTATVSDKAADNINYTLYADGVALEDPDYNISGTTSTTQEFKVTPSKTTAYTVEVSATGYDSIKSDAATVEVITPDVAESVTLTAEPSSINLGKSSTLTAELVNKDSQLGEATFELMSGEDVVETKTSSDGNAVFTVNPTETKTYTVKVSASGYNTKTSNEATVTVTVPDVAESVSLSTSADSVVEGNSATLTATINGKTVDSVTVKLVDGNGATVGDPQTVTGDSAEFTVTPSAKTTYKVVVSADNCNSVESNEVTVDVVIPKTFYLWKSTVSNIGASENWGSPIKLTMNSAGEYTCDADLSQGNNYITITTDSTNQYSSIVWNTYDGVRLNNSSTASAISQIYVQTYTYGDRTYNYPIYITTRATKVTFTFDGNMKLSAADAGSTPTETVTITVPNVDNAVVTATAGGTTYAEGETFTINVGDNFTVDVNGENGYTLNKISYNGTDKTATGAEFTATSGATTFDVSMNEPAPETVTISVPTVEGAAVKVTTNGTVYTSGTFTVEVGTEFTVEVTANDGYELKSIAYNGTVKASSPASFTASANGTAITVQVESTVPVVETVTITANPIEHATVTIKYVTEQGTDATVNVTEANQQIVAKKGTDFTVTVAANEGYKLNDGIRMNYAGTNRVVNPATYSATADGTLTITASVEEYVTGTATVMFKSARTYMYNVNVSVNGAAATAMTKPAADSADNIGTSYTGTLTFCWYKAEVNVVNGDTTTLKFTTKRTKLNATVTAQLKAGQTYYYAVDDIAPDSSTEVTPVELPSGNLMNEEMSRNYFRSARHLVYDGTSEDSVLGFTNIGGTVYMIGELLNNSNDASASETLSIKSATAVQRSITNIADYSDLQNTLLDVNMDGKLDIKDATLVQRVVVGLV